MSNIVRYILRTEEPVRLSSRSVSTADTQKTVNYISGSAIRGLIIWKYLSLNQKETLDSIDKAKFFKNLYFSNAMLYNNQELLPSPYCFFKSEKTLKTVNFFSVTDDSGKKQSSGDYISIKDGKAVSYKVNKSANLHINKEKASLFRQEFICPGQMFIGQIYDEEGKAEEIVNILKSFNDFYIGGSKGTGYGRCSLVSADITDKCLFSQKQETFSNETYLYLLSDLSMYDSNGNLCGINIEQLEKRLGVEGIKIISSSAKTVIVTGYNNHWKSETPSFIAYKAGSVFKISFKGAVEKKKISELLCKGIGHNRETGMGRVLLLDGFEKIDSFTKHIDDPIDKKPFKPILTVSEEKTMSLLLNSMFRNRIVGIIDNFLMQDMKIDVSSIANSQIGGLSSVLYDKNGKSLHERFDEHMENKKIDCLEKFKMVSIAGNRLNQFICNAAKMSENQDNLIEFISNLPKVSKEMLYVEAGGIAPILTKQECYSLSVYFIEGMIKRLLRKEVK